MAATRLPLAVVTGASSGIGRATAAALARRGFRTVLIARRERELHELARDLEPVAPSRALALDLSDLDAIPSAMADILAREGRPRVLVNCAGFGVFMPFLETHPDEFRRLMRVNFESAVEITRALMLALIEEGTPSCPARVFNVCSMAARWGPYGHSGYAASKGAMRAFTEVMQSESGPRIVFTGVYPGIIATEYFRHGSMAVLWERVRQHAVSPEMVAGAIASGVDRRCLSLYVPGRTRLLDSIAAVSHRAARFVVQRGMRRRQGDGSLPLP